MAYTDNKPLPDLTEAMRRARPEEPWPGITPVVVPLVVPLSEERRAQIKAMKTRAVARGLEEPDV